MAFGVIIPDVHEQIKKLKRILKHYKALGATWFLFLGDFMDSFNGFTEETHLTIEWLREHIQDEDKEFIFGNHDMHYAFPIDGVMCSGFDVNKLKTIRARLNDNDHWKKFKLLKWVGKVPAETDGNLIVPKPTLWLCSHAGVHPNFLHPVKGFDQQYLVELADDALWKLRYCQTVTPMIAAGRGRGGPAPFGGFDWLDWDREFVAIPGLNQIVGHSAGKKVRHINIPDSSYNYCVDTHLKHVVLVEEDGTIKIEELDV